MDFDIYKLCLLLYDPEATDTTEINLSYDGDNHFVYYNNGKYKLCNPKECEWVKACQPDPITDEEREEYLSEYKGYEEEEDEK